MVLPLLLGLGVAGSLLAAFFLGGGEDAVGNLTRYSITIGLLAGGILVIYAALRASSSLGRRAAGFAFVVGFALVGLALATSGVALFTITAPGFHSDTSNFERECVKGGGAFAGEELMDATQYITSWLPNADSEKIGVQGTWQNTAGVLGCNGAAVFIDDYRYEFLISLNGGPWTPYKTVTAANLGDTPPGFVDPTTNDNFRATVQTINGNLIGALRVQLWIENHLRIFVEYSRGWFLAAEDDALLVPGVGDVNFTAGQFEIGECAGINYDVGYARSVNEGGGWTIKLNRARDGVVLQTWAIADNQKGLVSPCYTIKAGDFAAGSDNIITATLLNDITGIKDSASSVIDDKEAAPAIKSLTITPTGQVKAGDEVMVTITAEPNKNTQLPITAYCFYIRSGPGTVITNGCQGGPSYTFIVQGTADLIVSGWVKDEVRSSPVITQTVDVLNPNDLGTTTPVTQFPLLLVLILATIGGLLATALAFREGAGSPLLTILVGGAAIVAVLILYAVGVVPGNFTVVGGA